MENSAVTAVLSPSNADHSIAKQTFEASNESVQIGDDFVLPAGTNILNQV